jgi:hypothetical protein
MWSKFSCGKIVTMNLITTARVLGYAGLIPFVSLAVAALSPTTLRALPFLPDAQAAKVAICTYAAIIVSFMAALHWAYALIAPWTQPALTPRVLAWSVIPPLAAWFALLGFSFPEMAYVLIACLIAVLYVDHCLRREPWFPAWFWPLRVQLTAVAVASLLVATIA